MPRYDYECKTCGHHFELRQSFASEPVANCPVCNNGSRRLIHSVPIVFKGSGFYVNDYGKGKSGANSSTGSSGKDKDSKAGTDSKSKSDSSTSSDSGTSSGSGSEKETTSAK